VGLALACSVAQACGSSSSGNDVTCGPGTVLDGSVCVAASSGPGDASVGGGDDGTVADVVEAGASQPFIFMGATAAAPSSPTALFVAWNPATLAGLDAGSGVFTYRVYLATSKGGENFAAPTVETPAGATSIVIDNGLTANTTYYVVVRAVDAAGHEDTNVVEQSAMLQADTTAPTFGGVTSVATAPQASLTISWSPATDPDTPAAAIVYDVFLATAAGMENLNVPDAVSLPGATSLTVSGLLASTKYYVVVRAVDPAGNEDLNPENVIEMSGMSGSDTTPPVFGGCTSAAAVDPQTISVTWQPASDNSTPPLQIAYDVFASTTPGGWVFNQPTKSFVATGTQPLTAGMVDGLKQNTTYYLICRARDLSGNEDQNTFARVATTPVDLIPPTFTGATGATNVTTNSAQLNWSAASDPQTATDEIVYLVYQSTVSGTEAPAPDAGVGEGGTAPIATSTPGASSITVSGLNSNTTYYFIVRAQNRAGLTDGNTAEVTLTTDVSFSNDIAAPILGTNCGISGCHVPPQATAPNGLVMTPTQAYSHLVNVPVVEYPGYVRVYGAAPSTTNHMQSYLYLKITGEGTDGGPGGPNGSCTIGGQVASCPPAGGRMPLGFPALSQANITTIKNWIDQGALNN
jgi:hypothetical protein